MKRFFIIVVLVLFVQSCSSSKEAVMPFRNMVYSGEKLLPIQENNSDWVIRIWMNNGTSVDRIITISKDSLFKNQGKYVELGFLDKKNIFSTKEKYFFKESDIVPKSGFENFFSIIDSLKLNDYKSQEDFDFLLDHEPFSLYVIEFKNKDKYNQIVFRTYFPMEDFSTENEFKRLEKIIFDEFKINYYLK